MYEMFMLSNYEQENGGIILIIQQKMFSGCIFW